MNLQGIAPASTSSLCVCQFHHSPGESKKQRIKEAKKQRNNIMKRWLCQALFFQRYCLHGAGIGGFLNAVFLLVEVRAFNNLGFIFAIHAKNIAAKRRASSTAYANALFYSWFHKVLRLNICKYIVARMKGKRQGLENFKFKILNSKF